MTSQSFSQRLRSLSFSRTILPVLAIIAIIVAIILVIRSQPDRTQENAVETPPKASSAFGDVPSVAGAGVVEPSSEIIEVGTSLPGVVTRVFVEPGQQVSMGEPLFAIDDRATRARITEANAVIANARAARETARAALATAQQQRDLYRGIEDPRAISRQEVISSSGSVRSARAQLAQAEADIRRAQAARASAATELERLTVRAPMAAEVLSVDIRPGEYANSGGPQGSSAAYMEIGNTRPLHVRIDIDENEIGRTDIGSDAVISPRGMSDRRVKAAFVRAEPLVTPKTSLTNSSSERVDVRVLQLIYQIPPDQGFFVGQQVDAFVRAKNAKSAAQKNGAEKTDNDQ